MARFVFELESVLEQRRREEEVQQRAVAELERERLDLEARIRADQAAIREEHDALRAELTRVRAGDDDEAIGGVSVPLVRRQAHASLAMIARTESRVRELAGLHERLARARLGLLEASIKRKALETLRERRHEAWKRAVKRREASETDDLAVMRAGRRDSSGLGTARAEGGEAA